MTVSGNENNGITVTNAAAGDVASVTINGTGANTIKVTNGTPTVTLASTASGNDNVQVNTASPSTINVQGGGNNSIGAVGSGPATITVDGNGANTITASGIATSISMVQAITWSAPVQARRPSMTAVPARTR